MNITQTVLSVIAAATVFTGCAVQTVDVDINNDYGPKTLRFDYRDVKKLSGYLVNDIINSGRLERKDNKRYVLVVGKVQNKINQRGFDMDQFVEPIITGLDNYGKIAISEALSDEMVSQIRDLIHDPMFAPSGLSNQGQVAMPDLCLTAKLMEQDIELDARTVQVEYYLKFVIYDLKSGVRFYSGSTPPIVKRGSNKTVSW